MFQQLSAKRKVLKYPAFQLIREQWRKIFKLTWIEVMAACIGGAIFLPYSVSYLIKLGVDESFANLSVTTGGALAFFTILGGAYLSDYVGRLRVLRVIGLFMIAFMFPYFFLLNTLNPLWIIVAQMLFYGVVELSSGCAKAVFTESFATKYRYSGSGIAAQFAQLVGAGLALAVIFPLFIVTYGVVGAWLPVALFGIAMCVINVIVTFFVKETKGTTLE